MTKMILLCFLFSLNLFANEEAIKRHIPTGYTYTKKIVDFNNDGKLDIVLELENLEKKIPKRVLEILDNSNTPNKTIEKENTLKIESIKKEEKTFFTKLLELFGSSIFYVTTIT